MVFVKKHQRGSWGLAALRGWPMSRGAGGGGGGASFFTTPIANINIPGNNELADYE